MPHGSVSDRFDHGSRDSMTRISHSTQLLGQLPSAVGQESRRHTLRKEFLVLVLDCLLYYAFALASCQLATQNHPAQVQKHLKHRGVGSYMFSIMKLVRAFV